MPVTRPNETRPRRESAFHARRLAAASIVALLVSTLALSCGGGTTTTTPSPGLFCMELQPDRMIRYQEVFSQMRELGVDWVRIGVAWEKLEPEPGRFEWSAVDGMVGSAQENGMSIMVTVTALSRWGSSRVPASLGKQGYQASSPPKDMDAYSSFVEALVGRYRGRGIVWQIENEPNGPAFWDGTREEYIELLKAGYAAVHRADPEAVVLAAGLACSFSRPELLEEKLQAIRSWYDAIIDSGAFDALDAHDYYPPEEGNPCGISFQGYLQRVKGWIEAKGIDVPLWVSEAGISSTPIKMGKGKIPFTPELQARDLTLIYEAAAAEGIPHVFWYKLEDTPEGVFTNMGLVAADGSRKPAWETYRELASE